MGKLQIARLGEVSDEADGPDLSAAHEALERALSEIFSIENGVELSSAIFGVPIVGDRSNAVTATGQIWMLAYKAEGVTSVVSSASGMDFYDNYIRHRLCLVDSTLQIWKLTSAEDEEPETWEKIIDLELVVQPALIDFEDVDSKVTRYGAGLSAGETWVLGLATDDIFTLKKDTVINTGETEFKHLTDQKDFKHPWLDVFAESAYGKALMIGPGGTHLVPSSIVDADSSGFALSATAPEQDVGLVGQWGNGTWAPMINWALGSGSHADAALNNSALLDGTVLTNAAFSIPYRGIYLINFQYAQKSTPGIYGMVMLRMLCYNCHQFPKTDDQKIRRRTLEHYYYDQPWTALETGREIYSSPSNSSPGFSMGPFLMVVPEDGSGAVVGFDMGQTNDPGRVAPALTISRIS